MDTRKHVRVAYQQPVRITWQDSHGQSRYVSARSIDVCEQGMAIEMAVPLEPRSCVMLRCDSLKLAGGAIVRHCRRVISKYVIGVEFSSGLTCKNIPVRPSAAVEIEEVAHPA